MIELSDQIRNCLDHPSDPMNYEKVKDICRTLDDITLDNRKIIKEIKDDISELQEKMESTRLRVH